MSQYLESIKVEGGQARNLKYHQRRFISTQQELWREVLYPNISEFLPDDLPESGIHKLRLVYSGDGIQTEIFPYQKPLIQRLILRYTEHLDYSYKSTNRQIFQDLKSGLTENDEILIINDGVVSDTSISNVAFFDGEIWWTPRQYLLPGTQRSKLLYENKIHVRTIAERDLVSYEKTALFNAMIEWHDRIELNMSSIIK